MVAWILKKILGSKNQRELKRLMPTVLRINEFDEQLKSLSDEELRGKTASWKEEISKISDLQEQWRKLDEILPEAFAVVKNAARRLKDRGQSFTVCDQPMVWDMVQLTCNCSVVLFCTEAASRRWRPAKVKPWSQRCRFT